MHPSVHFMLHVLVLLILHDWGNVPIEPEALTAYGQQFGQARAISRVAVSAHLRNFEIIELQLA